jgi:hypothetical protein
MEHSHDIIDNLAEEKCIKFFHGFWTGETTHTVLMKEARKRGQHLNQYMRSLAMIEAARILTKKG